MMPSPIRQIFHNQYIQVITGITFMITLSVLHFWFISRNLTTKFDDAYMFIRYAENFLHGHGIAWNPDGIQTYGTTSILYLLLIIIARMLFSSTDGGMVLTITSALLGFSSLVLMAIYCLQLSSSGFFKRSKLAIPILISIIFLPSPIFLFHTTSGMDTTLALLCNILLIIATQNWIRKESYTSFISLILASYFSFLARPDSLIYAIAFPTLYGLFFLNEKQWIKVAGFLVAFACVLAIDTGIKYLIFHDPLPLPFYAKTMGYYDGYVGISRWNPITYLFVFFRLIFPFIAIIIFSSSKKTYRLALAFFIPALVTFLYYFSIIQIMGYGARYYFPSIPFFVIGSFLLLDDKFNYTQVKDLIKYPAHIAVTIIMIAILWLPIIQKSIEHTYELHFIPPSHIYESKIAETTDSDLPILGWWESINAMSRICVQLPEGTRVAMSEYGLIGSRALQINIEDPLGLHNPFFAHNGFSSVEFFDQKPDMIWFPHPDYTKILTSIEDNPTLLQDYEYYPKAFDYGIAIRRDTKNYTAIHKIVEQIWKTTYPNLEMDTHVFNLK